MSDFDAADGKVAGWLQPLQGDSTPCGPDLEYDNEFLAITQAAAGKPESQFGPAEPSDWRAVNEMAEALFARTRDLRIAILWLRAGVRLQGYGLLPIGLRLLNGLIENFWDTLHPLPDPDDGDPYARVNALTLLRENEGLIGDLRVAALIDDRALGDLTVRAFEVALGLSPARAGEADLSKERVSQMLAVAVAKAPELRVQCHEALAQARLLISQVNDRLGIDTAPDLRPLYALVNGVASILPPEALQAEAGADGAEGIGEGGSVAGAALAARSLSGSVNSRDDAIRAIDMVCAYLERAEPASVAPLFLRRARQLINHNFLQLMKVLAPDALSGVAGLVGVDPEAVETPDSS